MVRGEGGGVGERGERGRGGRGGRGRERKDEGLEREIVSKLIHMLSLEI